MFLRFFINSTKKIPQGAGLAGREVCERNVLFFNPVFNHNSFDSIEMLCIIRYHNHVIDNVFRNDWLSVICIYTIEKWIGICLKGCGCYDFSFECSRVVRPASRLRESLMHEGQPQGIRRRVTASWRACHCLEI